MEITESDVQVIIIILRIEGFSIKEKFQTTQNDITDLCNTISRCFYAHHNRRRS